VFAELLGGAEGAILPALYIILICSVLERFAPLERYSIAARVPGILMNAAQMVFSVALMWPLQKLWGALGIRALATIPLWRWLAPLGTAGIIIQWLIGVLIADFFIYWRHHVDVPCARSPSGRAADRRARALLRQDRGGIPVDAAAGARRAG
jgi:sterol desaturase/sphingolipid hydroxylase (fatty acid hydroxylase superfamily)